MYVLREKPDEVPNGRLTASAVPPVTASWHAIVGFALTIDGYKAIGQKQCGPLANRVKSEFSRNAASVETLSLTELRSCLFFEQRRFNHFGHEPQDIDRPYKCLWARLEKCCTGDVCGAHLCLPRHGEIPEVSLTPRSKFRLLSKTEAEFRIPGPHRRKVQQFEGTVGRKPNAWSPELSDLSNLTGRARACRFHLDHFGRTESTTSKWSPLFVTSRPTSEVTFLLEKYATNIFMRLPSHSGKVARVNSIRSSNLFAASASESVR